MSEMSAIMSAVGTGTSMAGSIMGGIAAQKQGQFQAEIAEQNAKSAQMRAEVEARDFQKESIRRRGRLAAAIGASGVQFSGTPLDLLAEEAASAEEGRLRVLFSGEAQARQSRLNASAARYQGKTAMVAGIAEAGVTLLESDTTQEYFKTKFPPTVEG
jgi:septal ring factor EnvC (AmiA/AmiB activator)